MFRKVLIATLSIAVGALASAEITDVWVEPVYDGYLSDGTTYVYSYDLMVQITADDAWTVAGGSSLLEPWITVSGGTFYQSLVNDFDPPDPDLFEDFPDSEFTSFYTTHLGWPNTPDQGVSPGITWWPPDTPTELYASWYCTPDGNFYPGDFTITRLTVLAPPDADPTTTYADIDMLIGSHEGGVIPFTATVGIPEPGSLGLLALGGLALVRRRRCLFARRGAAHR